MNRSISIFLMAVMILQPILYFLFLGRFGATGSLVSLFDEIMLGGFAILSIFYIFLTFRIPKSLLVWIIFIVYAIALCYFQGLPPTSYLQILLDSKIYFYGLAAWLLMVNTRRFDAVVIDFFKILILLSIGFSVWQIAFPENFYSVIQISDQTRGRLFFTISGIFQSRVAFAQFLIIAIILFTVNSESRRSSVLLLVVLLFATFSRKELIFFLLGYCFFYLGQTAKLPIKSKVWIFLFGMIISFASVFLLWGYTSNEFGGDYIRIVMLGDAARIIADFFPAGTGPGTYGSLMSLQNPVIYNSYGTSDRVVYGLGLSGYERGPIFDLFLVNLTVEYGVGIVLPLAYIYYYGKGYQISPEFSRTILLLKIFLVYSAVMTPAFNNPTAFITFLAILSIIYKCKRVV